MKLLENKIHEIVAECLVEKMLRESIEEMVREAMIVEKKKKKYGKKEKVSKKESQKQFRSLAKKHIVNAAPLAYKLFPDMDKDAARSYLSKVIRGERPISNKDATEGIQMIRQMQG